MCTTPYREAGYKPRETGQPESKEDLWERSPMNPKRKLVKRSEVNPDAGKVKGLFRDNTKCPKCGSPTFTANVDDVNTRLCMNDACKWKGAVGSGVDFQRDYMR